MKAVCGCECVIVLFFEYCYLRDADYAMDHFIALILLLQKGFTFHIYCISQYSIADSFNNGLFAYRIVHNSLICSYN